MASFSIVIITFNAADQLDPTLKAASALSDNIIVVDSHSTDHTKQVCVKYNANHFDSDWLGYGATKNLGASLAKNDWILSIDSDEVIGPELTEQIQQLKLSENHVYVLDRINLLGDKWVKHSGWYPDWKPRLYNKNSVSWDLTKVHEELIIPANYTLKKLQGKLYHHAYPQMDDHHDKMIKYAKLSAEKMNESGRQYNFIKAQLAPGVRFLKTLFLQKGFLDGTIGLEISRRNAKLVRLKYQFLKELQNNKTV